MRPLVDEFDEFCLSKVEGLSKDKEDRKESINFVAKLIDALKKPLKFASNCFNKNTKFYGRIISS